MSKGFVKLNRKMFDHPFWNEARVYSKAEAWIDLIRSARFEATQEIVNNKVIELFEGELPISRRYLEIRWNWGSTKVSNFLKMLEKLGMTNHRQTNGQTVLILCNYMEYNKAQTINEPQNKPTTNHRQTNDKPNIKNIRTKEIKEREEEFKKQVFSHTHFSQKILNDFFLYWTEKNSNGKKMKFEMQRTFDVSRRLKKWAENEKNWNKGKEQPKAKMLQSDELTQRMANYGRK